jgi:hypothetical protein
MFAPLSEKVRVQDSVRKSFGKLGKPERIQVNEALDEFSAWLDHDRPLLKSRTFKKLEGNTAPGASHELYAWSDGTAGRLFGCFADDRTFEFTSLGGHL